MPSILNQIGLFQFENLIRNRIPFLLVNLGADIKGLFPSYYQTHLENQQFPTTAETALADVRARGVPAEQALLILSEDGAAAEALVNGFEEAGYTNVYYILGGVSALRSELGK